MRVRFNGGPRHGERVEMEDGVLHRMWVAEQYAYVNTFTKDEDGATVFEFSTDPNDPVWDEVNHIREMRNDYEMMRRREMEEAGIIYQFGPL